MTTIVIGAGIAGMTAALMARAGGEKVTIVAKGFGGLQLSNGTLDIFASERPYEGIAQLPSSHPYAKIRPEALSAGVEVFRFYVPLEGNLNETTVLPTALGALRRTSFYPASFAAGAIEEGASYLIVGIDGLKDFYPALATDLLVSQGVQARCASVHVTAAGDTALAYSRLFMQEGEAAAFGAQLRAIVEPGERIGIPAVAREAQWRIIQEEAGAPVFQIPVAPPSIPGLEANEKLRTACQAQRIDIMLNSKACGLVSEAHHITGVEVEVAGAKKILPADHVIYAGGGLDSGAIVLDSYGALVDTVFNLPVFSENSDELVNGDVWGASQPLYSAGLNVDDDMRPVDADGKVIYENLYAIGGMISGAQRHREKSGEGIALGSAAQAVAAIGRNRS